MTWRSHTADISLPELMFGRPVLSRSSFFSTAFWWFKQHCAIGHSCEQMLPRSLYALPFRLYCQLAYPALMELLKSRYEQILGRPAFVRACVPIRWEHGDKNLCNACRSCHSMHNNLELCAWKKNTLRQERRVLKSGVLVINMYKMSWLSFLADLNDQYCTALFQTQRQNKVLFVLSGAIYRLIRYSSLCVYPVFRSDNTYTKLRA